MAQIVLGAYVGPRSRSLPYLTRVPPYAPLPPKFWGVKFFGDLFREL